MTVHTSAHRRPRRRRLWLAAPLILGGLAIGGQPALGATLPAGLDGISPLPTSTPSLSAGDTFEVIDDLQLHAGDALKVGADASIDAGDVVAADTKVALDPGESLLTVEGDVSLDEDEILMLGDELPVLNTLPDLGSPITLPELPISVPTLPGLPVIVIPQLPLPVTPAPGGGTPPGGPTPTVPAVGGTPAAAPGPQGGAPVAALATTSGCQRVVLRTTIAGPARMKSGATRAFRITVRNRSFRPATGASVKLTLPRGFKVVGRAPKGTVIRRSTVNWRVGKVAPFRARTLKLVVRSARSSAPRVALKASTRGQCAVATRSKRVLKVTPTPRRALPAVTG